LRKGRRRRLGSIPIQVSVDFWHDFTTSDTITFENVPVSTAIGGTSVEVRGGPTAQVIDPVGIYGALGYTTDLGEEERQIMTGNLGLSIRW
jgi:autotransporter family porin